MTKDGFRPGRAVEHKTCPQRGEVCTPAGPIRHPGGRVDENYRQCSKCGRWVRED